MIDAGKFEWICEETEDGKHYRWRYEAEYDECIIGIDTKSFWTYAQIVRKGGMFTKEERQALVSAYFLGRDHACVDSKNLGWESAMDFNGLGKFRIP